MKDNPWRLTPRQLDVLSRLLPLDSNKAIAYDLGITERTVEVHMHQIMKQLQVGSRVQAAVVWDRWVRAQ